MRISRPLVLVALAWIMLAAVPAQAIIHPGDQLSVQVYGQQSLSQNVTVLPDGSVEYPLIGRVAVAGLTVDGAKDALASKLRRYVRQPFITVSIAQLGQPTVLVLGDVKTPGKYQLRSDARVTDAIAAAGGIAEPDGAMPDARVSDPQGDVSSVSLQKLLHDGDVSLDKTLGEGYVVYVPGPTLMNVVVTGAVDHPGQIQVAEGDKLSMAIAKAGNSSAANADLNHVRVLRAGADGKQQEYTVNLYQALEKGDSLADLPLKKGDTIYVPATRQKSGLFQNTGLLYILSRLIIP